MATASAIEKTPLLTAAPKLRVDNRQDQIIGIACRLFARRGYEGTSLRDIAEEANITKASVAQFLGSKSQGAKVMEVS